MSVVIAHRHEVFLLLVLHHLRDEVINLTRRTEEHLTLAVLHIFLDIEGDRLRHAEILHILGYRQTQLLGQLEEVVDGVA